MIFLKKKLLVKVLRVYNRIYQRSESDVYGLTDDIYSSFAWRLDVFRRMQYW